MVIYRSVAGLTLALSSMVFCVSLVHLFIPETSKIGLLGGTDMAMSLLGSSGSFGTGIALLMLLQPTGKHNVALVLSVTFFLIAFIQLAYLWQGRFPDTLHQFYMWQLIGFFGVSVILYFIGLKDLDVVGRLADGAKSLWGAPRWVFIWVLFILSPVNMAGMFFLNHPLGVAAILGLIYIFFTNVPLLIQMRGVNNSMSIPHLIPFGLVVGLAYSYLFTDIFPPLAIGSTLHIFAWCLLIVNSISFVFDLSDSLKWLRGETNNIPRRTKSTKTQTQEN